MTMIWLFSINSFVKSSRYNYQGFHTPFWNGAGARGVGKISGALTNIGKFDIVLMDVSIARLIPIIKLALVYYEKRERKKQV